MHAPRAISTTAQPLIEADDRDFASLSGVEGHCTDLPTIEGVDFCAFTSFEYVRAVWLKLHKASACTVYQSYEWQKAWFDTVGIVNNMSPLFVIGKRQEKAILLLPFVIERRSGLTKATFAGGSHANYQMGLYDQTSLPMVESILQPLMNNIAKQLSIDCFELKKQPFYWDQQKNPMQVLGVNPSVNSGASANLQEGFQALMKRGNAKRKRKILSRQERQLAEFGGYKFKKAETLDEAKRVFQEFINHKTPWFDDRGIKNPFEDDATQKFFHLLLTSTALENSNPLLQMHFVESDGEFLAISGSGEHDGQRFGYFTSINPNPIYAPVSPGALNFYKLIEDACKNDLRRFDFGVGEERYKSSWCDEDNQLFDIQLAVSLRGRLYIWQSRVIADLKRFLRQNKTLWTIAKFFRKMLGR